MSTEMPVPRRRTGRPTGWPGAATGRDKSPDDNARSTDGAATKATAGETPPAPTPAPAPAPVGARPELSRTITLRLRSTTEEHLNAIMEPLAAGRVDRTELIHALIEAATTDSAKAAVLARRRRQTEFD